MEKLVVFNDFANTASAFAAHGTNPDWADVLAYLSEGRFLVEAHAYVPIDPRNPHGRDRLLDGLWRDGWLTNSKVGAFASESYKCDFDVEITLDLMRTAEIVRPDIIVLMSGDKDFVPVVLELRRRGIRVEVAAFLGQNAARELAKKASGFIDLGRYLGERQTQAATKDEAWSDDAVAEGGEPDLAQSGYISHDIRPDADLDQ